MGLLARLRVPVLALWAASVSGARLDLALRSNATGEVETCGAICLTGGTKKDAVCDFLSGHFEDSSSGTSCYERFGGIFTSDTPKDCCECIQKLGRKEFGQMCPSRRGEYAVFVVAYKIGSLPLGMKTFFHTDLALCVPKTEPHTAPKRLGAKASSNLEVSSYLQDDANQCIEVVWDGRQNSAIWSPARRWRGNWPPGSGGGQAFGDGGLFFVGRKSIDLEDLKAEMMTCHGPGGVNEWRDFNLGTYDMIGHNCNCFTYQALRYLGLPDGSFSDDEADAKAKAIMAPFAAVNQDLHTIFPWLARKFTGQGDPANFVSSQCRPSAKKLGMISE